MGFLLLLFIQWTWAGTPQKFEYQIGLSQYAVNIQPHSIELEKTSGVEKYKINDFACFKKHYKEVSDLVNDRMKLRMPYKKLDSPSAKETKKALEKYYLLTADGHTELIRPQSTFGHFLDGFANLVAEYEGRMKEQCHPSP